MKRVTLVALLMLLACSFLAAGCAGESDDTGQDAAAPVAVDDAAEQTPEPVELEMPDADLSGVDEVYRDAVAGLLVISGETGLEMVESDTYVSGATGEQVWYVFEGAKKRLEITIAPDPTSPSLYMEVVDKIDPDAPRGSEIQMALLGGGRDAQDVFEMVRPDEEQAALTNRLGRSVDVGFDIMATTFHDDFATTLFFGDGSSEAETLCYALNDTPAYVRVQHFGQSTDLAFVELNFDGDAVATAGIQYTVR